MRTTSGAFNGEPPPPLRWRSGRWLPGNRTARSGYRHRMPKYRMTINLELTVSDEALGHAAHAAYLAQMEGVDMRYSEFDSPHQAADFMALDSDNALAQVLSGVVLDGLRDLVGDALTVDRYSSESQVLDDQA